MWGCKINWKSSAKFQDITFYLLWWTAQKTKSPNFEQFNERKREPTFFGECYDPACFWFQSTPLRCDCTRCVHCWPRELWQNKKKAKKCKYVLHSSASCSSSDLHEWNHLFMYHIHIVLITKRKTIQCAAFFSESKLNWFKWIIYNIRWCLRWRESTATIENIDEM